jgi:hypothetical protein
MLQSRGVVGKLCRRYSSMAMVSVWKGEQGGEDQLREEKKARVVVLILSALGTRHFVVLARELRSNSEKEISIQNTSTI